MATTPTPRPVPVPPPTPAPPAQAPTPERTPPTQEPDPSPPAPSPPAPVTPPASSGPPTPIAIASARKPAAAAERPIAFVAMPPGVPGTGRTPAPAARTAAPPAAKTSKLGAVRRGLLSEAKRFFFYGPEGIGKSSLLADVDNIILMDTDRGSGHIVFDRYPFRDDNEGHIPRDLDEVYAGIDDLLTSPHSYKALGIDTTDSLEALIWKKVCDHAGTNRAGDKIEGIEDFGYGKGYNAAADEWRKLLHRLDELRLRRNMHIVLAGHVLVKTFKNPEGEDYDRYRPKLDDRALGLLREWCEVIGLVTFEDVAKKMTKLASRARGVSTGARIIRLEHNAAWDGKCRLPMPSQIDLELEHPWAPFRLALQSLATGTPDGLRAAIATELHRLGDVFGTGLEESGGQVWFVRSDGKEASALTVRTAVAQAGDDVATLSKYLVVLSQSLTKELS